MSELRTGDEKLIMIKVSVTSWFKKYTKGFTELSMEVEEEMSFAGLLKALCIPTGEVGVAMLMNGEIAEDRVRIDEGYSLKNGDHILIIPHILGG